MHVSARARRGDNDGRRAESSRRGPDLLLCGNVRDDRQAAKDVEDDRLDACAVHVPCHLSSVSLTCSEKRAH